MLAVGAFVMQISVQGAWGVIPAHLNELSPGAARATIPAFVYQAGNFLASYNGPFQAKIAEANGGNYGFALALVAGGRHRHRRRHPLQPRAARRTPDRALTSTIRTGEVAVKINHTLKAPTGARQCRWPGPSGSRPGNLEILGFTPFCSETSLFLLGFEPWIVLEFLGISRQNWRLFNGLRSFSRGKFLLAPPPRYNQQ